MRRAGILCQRFVDTRRTQRVGWFGREDASISGAAVKVFGHGSTNGQGAAINSRASFVELASSGVDGVELDVRRAADDQLVVIHDDIYSSGSLVMETRGVDRPTDVLLLGEALDLCRGLVVNIELKNHPSEETFDRDQRIAELCVALLDQRGGVDDIIVSSFGLACIDRVIEQRPQTPTALLLLSRRPVAEIVVAEVSERHRAVHPYVSMIDDAFMHRCAEFDLQVNVWSSDDETDDTVRRMINQGVNGLITESPQRAIRLRSAVEGD